jgi:glutathione S-transferase
MTYPIIASPILYSLRNCPYAMRARIAIFKAQQQVSVREVNLKNKPVEMITASAKGTVPILVLSNDLALSNELALSNKLASFTVIDESIEVMLWALTNNDPDNLLYQHDPTALPNMLNIITEFDDEFKACLNAYKCAKRYRENNVIECRQACEVYINRLEICLTQQPFIMSAQESLVDIALLPFIRQFVKVERQWYLQSPYSKVRQWLNHYLQSPMFTKVMAKRDLWVTNDEQNQ